VQSLLWGKKRIFASKAFLLWKGRLCIGRIMGVATQQIQQVSRMGQPNQILKL
jgi:hypothetical protein